MVKGVSLPSQVQTIVPSRPWVAAIGILAVLLLGFYVRFDNLFIWLADQDRYFFAAAQTPLLLGVDGYYYLDIAKQIQADNYTPFDVRRHVPSGFSRPSIPPLLSLTAAAISSLFEASLEWVAILLPPFLGSLMAIPVFLIGRSMGRTASIPWADPSEREPAALVMGLVAAGFAALSPFMVARSAIGFFETDALNVTFALMSAWLAMQYGIETLPRRRLYWLAGWAVNLVLFLWWWEQTLIPVIGLAGLPILIAAVGIGWRSIKDLGPLLLTLALFALLLGFWKGLDTLNPAHHWQMLTDIYRYITGDASDSVFAAAGQYVSEQKTVSLERFVRDSSGGWPGFIGASLGLTAMALAVRLRLLYLAGLAIVASLSFTGSRFLIFTAPFFGLGIGFIAFLLWSGVSRRSWRFGAVALLCVSMAWGAVVEVERYDGLVPKRLPVLFEAMQALESQTPADSVIWANWGHGHPMIFYADRSTMADGIAHPSSVLYMLAVPQAISDPRMAANWISFCVAHGEAGLRQANALFGTDSKDWAQGIPRLQELLAAGPTAGRQLLSRDGSLSADEIEEQLAYFFPGPTRPAYLFLDYLSIEGGWYNLGNWDLAHGKPPKKESYFLLKNLKPVSETVLRGTNRSKKVLIDLRKGWFRVGDKTVSLREVNIMDGMRLKRAAYNRGGRYSVSILKQAGYGVFASATPLASVLHGLYFELRYDERFFTPFSIKPPYYSIWQVHGEKGEAAPGNP